MTIFTEGEKIFSPQPNNLFSFIFGAASDGLNPFETQLAGKGVGETLTMELEQSEMAKTFGHLFGPLKQSMGMVILPQELRLQFTVERVEKGEDREIIQAIASSVGSGCGGGGCDCGCS